MNKAGYTDRIVKLATIPQAMDRYKLGRTKLMQIAENCGAIRRIGRAVRLDIPTMDKEIDSY